MSISLRPLGALALALLLLESGCTGPADSSGGIRDCVDHDGDGFGVAGHDDCGPNAGIPDCDDTRANVNPAATDIEDNGIDEDCSGADAKHVFQCTDHDDDGYGTAARHDCPRSGLVDCNDADPAVNPGAVEIPDNGKDDDCQGGDAHREVLCEDGDEDGFGRRGASDCTGHAGQVDCNDEDPSVNPDALEVPGNEIDENCDGYVAQVPDNCQDDDHDGFGTQGKHDCGERQDIDCDDRDPQMFPGAPERCNGRDDDCDGQTDECPEAGQLCHTERKVCVVGLNGPCQSNNDCNEGLRCDSARRVCLGWTGASCQQDADCVEGRCDTGTRTCRGITCADMDCTYACRDDLGCYDCDDSDIGNGCDLGICAGYTCFEGDDLFHFVSDSEELEPVAQLGITMVDCARRKDWKGDNEQDDPFLCGSYVTYGLSDDVLESDMEAWACDEATDSQFEGGAADRELLVDLVGCGAFNLDDMRFLGPLRADAFYTDCIWFDGDLVIGPCEQFPATR